MGDSAEGISVSVKIRGEGPASLPGAAFLACKKPRCARTRPRCSGPGLRPDFAVVSRDSLFGFVLGAVY